MARWRSRRPDWKYGAQGPPTFGPSSQSSPSQRRPSRMPSIMSSDERSASVSSMRRTKTPPSRRAKSQLKSAVRAPPTCKCPVGEGAKRTRGVMSGKTGGEAGIRTLDTAFRPYNGLANRRLQPLGHLTAAINLSIRQASSYGNVRLPPIVPEIVPTSIQKRPVNGAWRTLETLLPDAAVLFADNDAGN